MSSFSDNHTYPGVRDPWGFFDPTGPCAPTQCIAPDVTLEGRLDRIEDKLKEQQRMIEDLWKKNGGD